MEVKQAGHDGTHQCLHCGCIQPFGKINGTHSVCSHCLRCRGCGTILGRMVYGTCQGVDTRVGPDTGRR